MESLLEFREKLPVFRAKSEILTVVKQFKTVIFVGETGCGKTTQIPQYLLEAGFAKHKGIAITQPRRIAAITIAGRVAKEVGTEIGSKVGYSIRFENKTSAATRIKYVTDGMLLRDSIRDMLLLEYSVVILDEVHERTLCNDLLLGIVKNAQKVREEKNLLPLKIIVMSATLEVKQLIQYFEQAQAYSICGRDYSIQILNTLMKQEHYVQSALITVFQIHQNEEEGDILVFCTGQDEIDSMVSETIKTSLNLPSDISPLHAFGLYSALPSDKLLDPFKQLPSGTRKVIYATNIAETSITIPNIKYVIDTGKIKTKSFNPVNGFNILNVQNISKAQAEQRAGRAGREFNGKCYRLYSVEEYQSFKDQSIPEILRCCLSNAVLQMVAMGIQDIEKFDFIDKPSDENIEAAIETLKELEAIIEADGQLKLTECGKKMVAFPLDPRFSKMIITSQKYKCTDEILTIISLLSVDSIFYSRSSEKDQFLAARKKFESTEGDLIMYLDVYKTYKKVKANPAWCKENYVNARNIQKAMTVRKQLNNLCERIAIAPCSCGPETIRILKCLASAFYKNVALFHENNLYKMVESNQKIKIHPSSCLFKKNKPTCLIYTELVQTSDIYMRNVSNVPEDVLHNIKPTYFKAKHGHLMKMKRL